MTEELLLLYELTSLTFSSYHDDFYVIFNEDEGPRITKILDDNNIEYVIERSKVKSTITARLKSYIVIKQIEMKIKVRDNKISKILNN